MTTHLPAAQSLGLGHRSHPLLGRRVIDHAHDDRIGILRALAPEAKGDTPGPVLSVPATPPVAWLAPEGGGVEWTTAPDAIEAAP
ncbi:hypothetical protein ACIGW8_21205 [Streptomyces sioyaensis]|uniref:hypothetical protein n=1 Tax=Streptomyces sioyaensis TaxID=67364 RepID=UPI0037CE46E4